jgi:hypothetical protein
MNLIIFASVILITSTGSWLANRSMKKKLRQGLGKKVKQNADIFSISAWMKVDQKTLDMVVHDHSLSHGVVEKMENTAVRVYGKRKPGGR